MALISGKLKKTNYKYESVLNWSLWCSLYSLEETS